MTTTSPATGRWCTGKRVATSTTVESPPCAATGASRFPTTIKAFARTTAASRPGGERGRRNPAQMEDDSEPYGKLMTGISGTPEDPLTLMRDALSLAFEALCRRLLASGALQPNDLPTMRTAAMALLARLQEDPNCRTQVGGARLAEAVAALFDRLDGTGWRPLGSEEVWETARMLTAKRGTSGAAAFAWSRVHEMTAGQDLKGVETWCWVLDALEELGRPLAAGPE